MIAPGQTLHGIYQQRHPLYCKYADVTIDCNDQSQEQIVRRIVAYLGAQRPTSNVAAR